jgi:hypothetical protein
MEVGMSRACSTYSKKSKAVGRKLKRGGHLEGSAVEKY